MHEVCALRQWQVECAARQAADFKKFARLLRDGGYQGWIALEYEGKEDPATAVPRHLDEMRAAFA